MSDDEKRTSRRIVFGSPAWRRFASVIDDDLWLLNARQELTDAEEWASAGAAALVRRRARLDAFAADVRMRESALCHEFGLPINEIEQQR